MRESQAALQTCEFVRTNGNRCKNHTAGEERFCWRHAKTWKHRFHSLTRNQTATFLIFLALALISIFEGIPSLVDWWVRAHTPTAEVVQLGSPPKITTDPKDPHTHTVTITMPKNGWVSAWGSGEPNIMWMNINAEDVGPARGHVYILLICRVADSTVDSMHDDRIEISQPFEPPQVDSQIALGVSQSFLSRLIPGKSVFMSLVIMPSVLQPKEIHVLADVERLKGNILITNSVFVAAKVVPGQKNKFTLQKAT
jgi:hypothetical protein